MLEKRKMSVPVSGAVAASSKYKAGPIDRHIPHPNTGKHLRDPSALLHNLTELFVARDHVSRHDVLKYEELAGNLISSANEATLTYVAARLAGHSAAPAIVLDRLARSSRQSAIILSEHCIRLDPALLLELSTVTDPAVVAAIARRPALSGELAKVISRRKEPEILRSLAANPSVNISGNLQANLVGHARTDCELAEIVLARCEKPEQIEQLFLYANQEVKTRILEGIDNFNFSAEQIRRVKIASPVLTNWLVEAAQKGKWDRIAQELAKLTKFPASMAEAYVQHPSGDGLALLLAAGGVPSTLAVRIFLACAPAISHSCERIFSLSNIIDTTPAHAALAFLHRVSGQGSLRNLKMTAEPRAEQISRINVRAGRSQSIATGATSSGPEKKVASSG